MEIMERRRKKEENVKGRRNSEKMKKVEEVEKKR